MFFRPQLSIIRHNWVEDAGGLPPYICEIARAIERQGGHDLDSAIPIAVSRAKVWATGKGVSAKTQAKAAAAVTEWEKKKASANAKSASKKVAASEVVTRDLSVTADALLRLTMSVASVYDSALDRVLAFAVATSDPTSTESRKKYAKSGISMPDGSYPIPNVDYLKRAIKSIGRTPEGDRPKVKAHIRKRARALGATNLIPDDWN